VLRGGGVLLIALAIVGFATVADDLRHFGEIAATTSVLLAGASLVAASTEVLSRHLACQWVPVGLAAGLVAGMATDAVPVAAALGLLAGLFLARLRRDRRSEARRSPSPDQG